MRIYETFLKIMSNFKKKDELQEIMRKHEKWWESGREARENMSKYRKGLVIFGGYVPLNTRQYQNHE